MISTTEDTVEAVPYMDSWREDERIAHGWLVYLGGAQTADAVTENMGVDLWRVDWTLTRLGWRGLAEQTGRGWIALAPPEGST